MCFHTLKNETNNAHKHILITTRYCRGHTPLWIPIDLLSSSLYPYAVPQKYTIQTNSYPHVLFLYWLSIFYVVLIRTQFYSSWPPTAILGTPTTKITLSIYESIKLPSSCQKTTERNAAKPALCKPFKKRFPGSIIHVVLLVTMQCMCVVVCLINTACR